MIMRFSISHPFFRPALFTVFVSFVFTPAQGQELEVIALEGTQAPGLPDGVQYQGAFERPAISGDGYVAFKATVTTDPLRHAIFFGKPGKLELVALQDDPAPGAGGEVFCKFSFSNPVPSFIPADDGSLAFSALVLPPGYLNAQCGSAARFGIWVYKDGGIELVALEGEQAADVAEGLVYREILVNDKHFRYRNGQINFTAFLHDPDTTTDLGISMWSGEPGALQQLVLEGDPAPGLPGKTITGIGDRHVINQGGRSVFWSVLSGLGSDQALWTGSPGDLETLWKSEAPAPEYGDGYNFFRFTPQAEPWEWGLNDAGASCFPSPVFHEQTPGVQLSTLWRVSDSGREVLASEEYSSTGIGDSYAFTQFRDCWVNGPSQVLFRAGAVSTEPADTREGIWRVTGSDDQLAMEFIASDSDTLSNGDDDYPVANIPPDDPHFNKRGSVAFQVAVFPPGEAVARTSIWLNDGETEKLLAIWTQELDDGYGTVRTLGNFSFGINDTGSGNQDGRPSALSDYDQAVFKSTLSGGLDAILVSPHCCDRIFKDGFEDPEFDP
jgi:hypothetical protein